MELTSAVQRWQEGPVAGDLMLETAGQVIGLRIPQGPQTVGVLTPLEAQATLGEALSTVDGRRHRPAHLQPLIGQARRAAPLIVEDSPIGTHLQTALLAPVRWAGGPGQDQSAG